MYPTELRYTRDHEWVRKDGDGTLTVGLTAWAVKQLGEVVFVDQPAVGTDFDQEDTFGTIESVKAVSELFIPVAGKVVAVNDDLIDSPELVNDDPYGDGWMITLRPSDAKAYDGLMSAAQYEKLVTEADD